jgi:hypothetical protein
MIAPIWVQYPFLPPLLLTHSSQKRLTMKEFADLFGPRFVVILALVTAFLYFYANTATITAVVWN